jgi:hypothetical protein
MVGAYTPGRRGVSGMMVVVVVVRMVMLEMGLAEALIQELQPETYRVR